MTAIRPDHFDDFHGQPDVIENLKISVRSAKRQDRVHGHVLFTGPAGLGKTTLAMSVLPTELGCEARFVNCAAVKRAQDLTVVLTTMREGDILFLDEVHALPVDAREHLLTVMEDSKVCVSIGDTMTELVEISLPQFTVVAATTRQGQLDTPTLSRFQHHHRLSPYSDEDMMAVIAFHAVARGCSICPSSLETLAAPSHGVARRGVNLLESCIDTYYSSEDHEGEKEPLVDDDVAKATLKRLGYVDAFGPDELRYIGFLQGKESVGLKTLAAGLDEQPQTIEEVFEPWLLRSGYVEKRPSGRALTDKAHEWIAEQR